MSLDLSGLLSTYDFSFVWDLSLRTESIVFFLVYISDIVVLVSISPSVVAGWECSGLPEDVVVASRFPD